MAIGDGGGTIHLVVRTVLSKDIPASNRFPVGWQSHDSFYACLEIADTGVGIALADIEKVFDPFFSSKFTGRGLGLSVVLGIVRSCSGVVTVESEAGLGSVFRLYLPLSADKPSPEHIEQRADSGTAQATAHFLEVADKGAILLVEDEASLRRVAANSLKGLGFEVLAARDGIEALDMFRAHKDRICLVLCDLTMPRMDGWETIAALRRLSPCIPVILSSGYDEAQVMAGDHPEKPQAFLSKPYEFDVFCDTIFRVLKAHLKS
jgi:CheY-like chemotaxis protein